MEVLVLLDKGQLGISAGAPGHFTGPAFADKFEADNARAWIAGDDSNSLILSRVRWLSALSAPEFGTVPRK